jgi:hypothetical protein
VRSATSESEDQVTASRCQWSRYGIHSESTIRNASSHTVGYDHHDSLSENSEAARLQPIGRPGPGLGRRRASRVTVRQARASDVTSHGFILYVYCASLSAATDSEILNKFTSIMIAAAAGQPARRASP